MKKKLSILVLILLINCGLIFYMSKNSFALEYSADNPPLFYKDDLTQLSHDLENYINDIDDFLIPNGSFLYSNILSENYDALVNFAMAYVINNHNLYEDSITAYEDREYISLDIIYDITYKYFGIRDFTIINRNTHFKDNNIALVLYNGVMMKANIKNIKAYKEYEYVVANVVYDNGDIYKYIFREIDGILRIYNVEVVA